MKIIRNGNVQNCENSLHRQSFGEKKTPLYRGDRSTFDFWLDRELTVFRASTRPSILLSYQFTTYNCDNTATARDMSRFFPFFFYNI